MNRPLTLVEAADALRDRRVSSVELMQDALARAESTHERLNAFIEIEHEDALAAARKADTLQASGARLASLHGVPLAHKDMFDRAGKVTGCGSKIRGRHVAEGTATVMQRLDAAGAVSIGRLNMSEFAMGPTGANHHHGRALNPIAAERITGGSSSGSGAAVGAGIVFGALGSDTGGSIRLPSACCGVVGIKPTQGRVSRHGAMPLSFSQDCIGPLARTVEDALLLLRAIAGPDGLDVTCLDIAPIGAAPIDVADLRIGVCDGFFAEGLDVETATGLTQARKALGQTAASMTAVPLPDFSAIGELANVVAMSEAATVHFNFLRERPQDYGPQVRMRLSQGLAVPAPIYLRALQLRARMLAEFLDMVFSACDALVVPVMPILPPLSRDVDVGADPSMNSVVSALTRFTRPFSYLGLPVVAIPVACSASGLPVSVQVVARPWREDIAAAIALSLEKTLSVGPFAQA